MATLTINQIAALALSVGLSGEAAAIATAIAMGESNGNTEARGDTTITNATWGPSIGLWQVRSINSQRGSGGERDELANTDPTHNAKAMMSISGGGKNWRPWSVYTSGKYRAYLAQARLAVANPGAVPAGGASGGTPGGSASGGGVDLASGGTWARVGLFVLGGGLVLVVLYKTSGAGNIIPVGRALKAVKAIT